MKVLGVSAFYHDSAACLVADGAVLAAAQEERFTRIRFDASFPLQAIRSCLATSGTAMSDVHTVAFYEKPLLRFDRAMATFLETFPRGRRAFVESTPAWMRERLRVSDMLRDELGWRGPVVYVKHHEAHAASAFYASPFSEAAILTVDGVGEWTTTAIGHGRDGDLALTNEIVFPHSLGLFYAAVTEYLGFEVLSDEYKVMGLAAYGEPRFASAILDRMIDLRDDGSYRLNLDYFRFVEGQRSIDRARFEALFATPQRAPDAKLEDIHADIAASAQAVLEEALLRQARHAHAITGSPNLVMAGGVALNAVANGRIAREGPFEHVWAQPAAGDAGGALGAALLATHRIEGLPRPAVAGDSMKGALLGPEFDRDRMLHALASERLDARELDEPALDTEVARRLADGQVVGWFQGRMELGPRALGSRSILADARRPDAQRRVNERIKFREGFRPFAPAVLESHAQTFFELRGPSAYMLFVSPLADAQRVTHERARGLAQLENVVSTLPAVTHVDGTARVQTVHADRHPRFSRLLTEMYAQTGCPVLLNTSFYRRCEPIVCTPEDAIHPFLASEMDALALGPFLVDRPAGPARALPPPPPRAMTQGAVRSFARDTTLALAIATVTTSWLALHRHSAALALGGGLALTCLALALYGNRAPRTAFTALAVRWRPVAEAVGRTLATVTLTLIYFAVLGPIALLRRRSAPILTRPVSKAELRTYWTDHEPSRGGPDRMY